MNRTKVISGFPGVGKSYLNFRREILDLESSCYGWIFDFEKFTKPERNPDFPKNYVDAICEEYEKDNFDFILISSHESVRNELKNRGVPYIIVAPKRELKNEYLIRYLRRGNEIEFIEMMNSKWDEFIDGIEKDGQPIIWLEHHIYLAEVLGI